MAELPSLGGLNPSRLQPVDAPSTLLERAFERFQPWRMRVEQYIRPKIRYDPDSPLLYRVDIIVSGGATSKHKEMVKEMDAKLDPIFLGLKYAENLKSGVAYYKCSMPEASTLEWRYEKPWDAMMPPGGTPPVNEIPGGSVRELIKLAFGEPPFQLLESEYTYEAVMPETTRLSEYSLIRIGDVEERDMNAARRGLRSVLGFGEYHSRR